MVVSYITLENVFAEVFMTNMTDVVSEVAGWLQFKLL